MQALGHFPGHSHDRVPLFVHIKTAFIMKEIIEKLLQRTRELTTAELAFFGEYDEIFEFNADFIYRRSHADEMYPLECIKPPPIPWPEIESIIYKVELPDGTKGIIIMNECDREEY